MLFKAPYVILPFPLLLCNSSVVRDGKISDLLFIIIICGFNIYHYCASALSIFKTLETKNFAVLNFFKYSYEFPFDLKCDTNCSEKLMLALDASLQM